MLADLLQIILDEMRRLEKRMKDRMKWLEAEIHCNQDEAMQSHKEGKAENTFDFWMVWQSVCRS